MTLDVVPLLEAIRGQDKWHKPCSCWGSGTAQASLKPWMERCCWKARSPGPGGWRYPLQQGIIPLWLRLGSSLIPVSNSVYVTVPKVFVPGSVLRTSLTIFTPNLMDNISVRVVFGCRWLDLMNGSFLLFSLLPFLCSLLFPRSLPPSHHPPLSFPPPPLLSIQQGTQGLAISCSRRKAS